MNQALLNGKVVSADQIDPIKHKYIGSFRKPTPPDNSFMTSEGTIKYVSLVICACEARLRCQEDVFDHYMRGHFDLPQYIDISNSNS